MNWLQTTRGLLRTLFRKRKLDEMDDELRSHVEMQTQENIQAGMNLEKPATQHCDSSEGSSRSKKRAAISVVSVGLKT